MIQFNAAKIHGSGSCILEIYPFRRELAGGCGSKTVSIFAGGIWLDACD
jgi:hypothetical protein